MTDKQTTGKPPEGGPADKPPMPGDLRPFVDKARARHQRRPPNPGVRIEKAEGQNWTFGPTHRDLEPWQVQIFDAFGTRSASACWTFLNQLAALCMGEPDYGPMGWAPNEQELNAALNIVSGVRPRNEIEAALAAQMVAVHFMQMTLSAQALRNPYGDLRTMAVAGKLARTYAMQCETMAKLKGRTGKQRITVKYERHNHHHDHRHLHAEGQGGGSTFGGRPHASNGRPDGVAPIEHGDRPALHGPDPTRDVLPMPCDQGSDAVPNARRRARVGRPNRPAQRGL